MKLTHLIQALQDISRRHPESNRYDIQFFGEVTTENGQDNIPIKSPHKDTAITVDIDCADKIISLRVFDPFVKDE